MDQLKTQDAWAPLSAIALQFAVFYAMRVVGQLHRWRNSTAGPPGFVRLLDGVIGLQLLFAGWLLCALKVLGSDQPSAGHAFFWATAILCLGGLTLAQTPMLHYVDVGTRRLRQVQRIKGVVSVVSAASYIQITHALL